MFRKFLKVFGYLLSILILLLVCVIAWQGMETSKHNQAGMEFLEKNLAVITSWDLGQIKPLLTPEAFDKFNSQDGQKRLVMFSKLGKLKDLKASKYLGTKMGVPLRSGKFGLVNFSFMGQFESGNGLLIITLAASDDAYLIHNINISSNVFFD